VIKLTDEIRQRILAKVRHGVHPAVAFRSEGMSRQYLPWCRAQARNGDQRMAELIEAIEAAEAQCESDAVIATSRASSIQRVPVTCPGCGAGYQVDAATVIALDNALDGQQVKASASQHAMQRLERRFSKRWSPRIVHTVEEEHSELLDVAQRVLAPEVFELLLESYLARRNGESEAADGQGEPSDGGVH
jgi:hypothetical protein